MAIKPRVLVVEPDPQVRQLLADVLPRMGAETPAFEPCETATDRINRDKFDGIFLSLEQPGTSGLQLAEHVRWSKSNSRCPIVMIADTMPADLLKKCFRAGVNFFLYRPVTFQQLEILLNATRGMMVQERRRYQRAPVQLPVHCRWSIQSLPQTAAGQSLDLSASGMRLALSLTPPPGGVVELSFRVPGDPQLFDLTGRVVRIGPGQEVGLTFVGLDSEQRRRLMDFTDHALHGDRKPLAAGARQAR